MTTNFKEFSKNAVREHGEIIRRWKNSENVWDRALAHLIEDAAEVSD
jgi:hypothetical protein